MTSGFVPGSAGHPRSICWFVGSIVVKVVLEFPGYFGRMDDQGVREAPDYR